MKTRVYLKYFVHDCRTNQPLRGNSETKPNQEDPSQQNHFNHKLLEEETYQFQKTSNEVSNWRVIVIPCRNCTTVKVLLSSIIIYKPGLSTTSTFNIPLMWHKV